MSVITTHCLSIKEGSSETIKNLLINDGIFDKHTVYRYNREGDIEPRNVESVDLGMCDKEIAYEGIDPVYAFMSDISKNNEKHLSKGWEIIKVEGTRTNFRKKWDETVYKSIGLVPACINETYDELVWYLNYNYDDRPAFAISKKYPDITFEYRETTEGKLRCHIIIKNGEVVENLRKIASNKGGKL